LLITLQRTAVTTPTLVGGKVLTFAKAEIKTPSRFQQALQLHEIGITERWRRPRRRSRRLLKVHNPVIAPRAPSADPNIGRRHRDPHGSACGLQRDLRREFDDQVQQDQPQSYLEILFLGKMDLKHGYIRYINATTGAHGLTSHHHLVLS
jgi:hypothetical protein